MSNFHPELYTYLVNNFESEEADKLQTLLGTIGFTEQGLPYPLTAKYNMCLEGIHTENIARNRKSEELTGYVMDCVKQMNLLTKEAYGRIR
jgi:hypothetical protein